VAVAVAVAVTETDAKWVYQLIKFAF
jgi:hypothetical protein